MRTTAQAQLQQLLGHNATDDATWAALLQFERVAVPIVEELWAAELRDEVRHWALLYHSSDEERARFAQRCAAAVARIEAELGAAASQCAAIFWLHPQLWRPRYDVRPFAVYRAGRHAMADLLQQLAGQSVLQAPPPSWLALLCQRLLTLCVATIPAYAPDLNSCVSLLLEQPEHAAPLLDALSAGEWLCAWQSAASIANYSGPALPERLRELWQQQGSNQVVALLRRLYQLNRLNEASFEQMIEAQPDTLRMVNRTLVSYAEQHFYTALRELSDKLLWQVVSDLRAESWPALMRLQHLSGGRYLLRLAEEVERQGITTLRAGYNEQRLTHVLAHLLGVLRRRPDDDGEALVALLQRLSAPTLLALLPYAGEYEAELCTALGWQGSRALLVLLRQLQQGDPAHSTDPSAGVVRRHELLAVAELVQEQQLRALLDALTHSYPAGVLLMRAALGWNRKELRRMLGRRNQLAARALPLLPLEQPDELLARYLLLTRYQREANSSPAGRKAFERAAAQAGLANLALHAGYADATRLEWAMEDRLGAEGVNLGRSWQIEGYSLSLALRESGPALAVRGKRGPLKRMPSLVTRDYAFREVRATLEQLQDQERRYRQAFLEAMRHAQPLSADELHLLRRNPLAVHLLERLVLLDESGASGLFRADDCSLEGTLGERVPVSGPVRVAHAYTLAQAGTLADWQAEIVRRKLVQPFAQIFREIYLLTPAEREAAYSSARLAGRQLRGRQALAVLAQLGWLLDGGSAVRKPFYALGFAAHFETGHYHDYEDDAGAATGALSFWPLHYDLGKRNEQRLPLASIPPLVFSEVLRDIDLVTKVAHQNEEGSASREVLQQRGNLVRATLVALGLEQANVEEPYVAIRGQRASYRIHLATGAVYLASGQYLCIVPGSAERKAIYLPFESGGEPVLSEIVSKLLLLCNDSAIADSTILAQIGATP